MYSRRLTPQAATQVFERDCLIHLGTAVAPVGAANDGDECLTVQITGGGMSPVDENIPFGELRRYLLPSGEKAALKLHPSRRFDLGVGKGTAVEAEVTGGIVGLVIDTRGRPLEIPADSAQRVAQLAKWQTALDTYPTL